MSLTKIETVDPGSPARRAGVRPGETLTHINGHPVADVMDYKFYSYDPRLELTLREEGGGTRTVRIRKGEGEDLGLNFETYLMDRARSCANNCIFCFVDQMPPGMRETLYFKDDDARLSFLMGNYITLTNLSEREIARIIDLHISPINVSVHTTAPELRVAMLKNRNAGKCLEQMARFARAGITMNCQIVSCPGINDGPALQRTLEDLVALQPGVNSVSVVPVGVTKFREGLCRLEPYTPETAAAVLDQVEAFAGRCLERLGTRLVWCSDEFYLKAGRPLPGDEFFEDYTQLENGVGMLRLLEVEFNAALYGLTGEETAPPFAVATGVSAAPYIAELARRLGEKCPGVRGKVYAIENRFFGETINVAGLVTGGDLIGQLRGKELGERLLIPSSMLRDGENVFLDDVTLEEAEGALGVPIVPVEQDGGALCDAMLGEGTPEPRSGQGAAGGEEYYTYNQSRNRRSGG